MDKYEFIEEVKNILSKNNEDFDVKFYHRPGTPPGNVYTLSIKKIFPKEISIRYKLEDGNFFTFFDGMDFYDLNKCLPINLNEKDIYFNFKNVPPLHELLIILEPHLKDLKVWKDNEKKELGELIVEKCKLKRRNEND